MTTTNKDTTETSTTMMNSDEESGPKVVGFEETPEVIPVPTTTKGRPGLSRLPRSQSLPILRLSVYRIEGKRGGLVDADLDEAIAARQKIATAMSAAASADTNGNGNGNDVDDAFGCATKDDKNHPSYWIDADVKDGGDAKELYEIIQQIHLSPFLKRHLAKPNQIETPQCLSVNRAVFMVMRVIPPNEDRNTIRYVAALAVKGLLVTVTTRPKQGAAAEEGLLWNQSSRLQMEERELPEATTSGALVTWLQIHVRRVAEVSQQLRSSCFELDEKMDRDITDVELEDLVALKKKSIMIVAVAEEQWECVETLKEGESATSGLDFTGLRGSMGLVMATAAANERMALRLEKKVADLRATYDSYQQDKINKRLEILTVLSAIFLPLTLMAGIWGMNFTNMPELSTENGYWVALSSMAIVTITLLTIFFRYGWFS